MSLYTECGEILLIAALLFVLTANALIYFGNNSQISSNQNTPQPTVTPQPVANVPTITDNPTVETTTSTYQEEFSDDFSGSTLDPRWSVDVINSSILLTGTGILQMVPDSSVDQDGQTKHSAARILQPVSGDWIIETKVDFLPINDIQSAGIILSSEEYNNVIASRTFYSQFGGSIVRSVGKYINYIGGTTYFRVKKEGDYYTGWYSSDGTSWILNGEGTDNMTVGYVGLIVACIPGSTTCSEADFDYFTIKTLDSSSATTIPVQEDTVVVPTATPVTTVSSSRDPSRLIVTGGESRYVYGSEYILAVLSVDTKVVPKQVWFSLSKGDQKLDDKVISEGDVYTFTTKDGDVIFKAKIDNIYSGPTSDIVTFTDISFK